MRRHPAGLTLTLTPVVAHSIARTSGRTVDVSVRCLQIHTLILAAHLSISTFSPRVHLAVVFGVVVIERRLAVSDPDHAAVVWVVTTIVAEEFPTIYVLWLAGDELVS